MNMPNYCRNPQQLNLLDQCRSYHINNKKLLLTSKQFALTLPDEITHNNLNRLYKNWTTPNTYRNCTNGLRLKTHFDTLRHTSTIMLHLFIRNADISTTVSMVWDACNKAFDHMVKNVDEELVERNGYEFKRYWIDIDNKTFSLKRDQSISVLHHKGMLWVGGDDGWHVTWTNSSESYDPFLSAECIPLLEDFIQPTQWKTLDEIESSLFETSGAEWDKAWDAWIKFPILPYE